jgi:hypothetical protein
MQAELKEVFTRIAGEQFGFVTDKDIEVIRGQLPTPSMKVLVRCGMDRFVCGLDTLEARMAEVKRKGDYVRDVCIPNNPHPSDWIAVGYNPPRI